MQQKAESFGFPRQIYQRSSLKALISLTRSLLLMLFAYLILTQLPWFLLPLGWALSGTTLASLLAVGYSCKKNTFFDNIILNHIVGQLFFRSFVDPFRILACTLDQGKRKLQRNDIPLLQQFLVVHLILASGHFEFRCLSVSFQIGDREEATFRESLSSVSLLCFFSSPNDL